jgi:hypothetical protein
LLEVRVAAAAAQVLQFWHFMHLQSWRMRVQVAQESGAVFYLCRLFSHMVGLALLIIIIKLPN